MPKQSSTGSLLPYDVVLRSSDGIDLGLMLAHSVTEDGQPGAKLWTMGEIPTPVNVRVSEEGTSLVDLPPELEAAVFRDNHIGGIGELLTGIGSTKYFTGNVYSGLDGAVTKPPFVDLIQLPTSEGKVRAWCVFNGMLFVSDGRYLHKSTNGTSFVQELDVGANNIITSVVRYGADDNGTGIVVGWEVEATQVSGLYYFSQDGATFTQATSDTTRLHSHYFVRDETLFALKQPNIMYTTTDPFTATSVWAGPTEVGDTLHKFQGGFVVADVLILFKTDRVYTVDSNDVVRTLVAQFAELFDTTNFQAFTAAHNSYVYFTVDHEVWQYDPASGNIVPLGVTRLPDTVAQPSGTGRMGLAYDGIGVFCVQHAKMPHDADEHPSLLRIVFDAEDTPTFERWVTALDTDLAVHPQGPLHTVHIFPTLTTGRHLFFATDTPGTVGRMDLFRAADPKRDPDSVYALEPAYLYTGNITHNFPGQAKDYTEVAVELDGLDATTSVDIYYYLDADFSTRYTLREQIRTNGLHTLTFPEPVTARSLMLVFRFLSEDSAKSPRLISWTLRASVKFRLREVVNLTVKLIDHIVGRDGRKSPYTAQQLRALIRRLRETDNIRIRYTDLHGYTFENVRILPGFHEESVTEDDTGEDHTLLSFKLLRVA